MDSKFVLVGLVLLVLIVLGVLAVFGLGHGSPSVSNIQVQPNASGSQPASNQNSAQNNANSSLNSPSSGSSVSNNSTPPPSSGPTILSDTEKVASAVETAVTEFASLSLPVGTVVQFTPFNVSFQAHQNEQTNFQTPDSFKSYNPFDPNTGGTNNLFYNNLYVEVFPSIPGGEVQQTYVEVKNVNGFQVTYQVENPNSPAESYLTSLVCYSDPALGAKYIVQAQFNQLNYYNTTSLSWSKMSFNDFINDVTSSCSTIK